MSTAVRQALSRAASTVQSVECTPYFRQSTTPGTGFVRLDRRVLDDSGLGFMDTWQICVLLSQEQHAAEQWIDDNSIALVEALQDVGIVTVAQPVQLSIPSAGTLPALVVTVVREQDDTPPPTPEGTP